MGKYDYIYDMFKEIVLLNYKINYQELIDINLYPGQPIILERIFENNGITQSELSNITLKKPATITTMLNRLEQTGDIDIKDDINDKRLARLYLTNIGMEKYHQMMKLKKKMGNIIFEGMSEDDLSVVYRLMLKIKNNLEKMK